MIRINPFTLTYEALYKVASENTVLESLIRPGNMIKLDHKNVEKKSIGTADLPEMILTQTGVSGQLIISSSTTELIVGYTFAITAGSWDLSGLISEIQWGLITTSASWCASLGELTWNDRPFVHNVALGEILVALNDFELNRGISGWSIIWPLEVAMRLSTAELRSFQLKE